MDQETRDCMDGLGDKIDIGFTQVHTRLDAQKDTIHGLDMAIQETNSNAALCKSGMEPRVLHCENEIRTVKAKAKEQANKLWSVARPVLVKLFEMAVIGGLLYFFTQVMRG